MPRMTTVMVELQNMIPKLLYPPTTAIFVSGKVSAQMAAISTKAEIRIKFRFTMHPHVTANGQRGRLPFYFSCPILHRFEPPRNVVCLIVLRLLLGVVFPNSLPISGL